MGNTHSTFIDLSISEQRIAAYIGIDRFARNRANKRTPTFGARTTDWQLDIIGAWGECAVAKATGRYWMDELCRPDNHGPDVGPFHVRATDHPDGRLILHKDDPDTAPFILVRIIRIPRCEIVGWTWARDGKSDTYWETFTGRPAYFVPDSQLRPLTEITATPTT